MAQLKDKKQSANKAKIVKKTKSANKVNDKTKKEISTKKDATPAVVNLGGKAKEISKKGLSDLSYSDYYKDYLSNKKDHKPDTKKIASLFKKAAKPKNLGFSKIQQPKVFNATSPISYTKEVASNGYGKYFSKPGSQTVKAIPTVAVNLPAPIDQTQQFVEPNFQSQNQYSNPYPTNNNFNQNVVLPVKYNQFNNPRNNFYPNQEPGFINYNNQNFNQLHPEFPRNNNPRFSPIYQGFNNYPNNYFSNQPLNPFNQSPIDNVSTEQLLNFNVLDNGLPGSNNLNNNSNPNAITLANQRSDAVVLNQVTKLLDIMQRQMMTQQIILEKQQNQIEHQQDVIERLQTKLIEGQNQISTQQDFGYSDSAEIEPTDFLETQEHQFNGLDQKYYDLDKTRKIAKNDQYDHFVDLSATNKIDHKKSKPQDTVHVTDTLEYETDEIGSGEIAESDLIEYTDFDDSEDLIDPNLSEDNFEAKKLSNDEAFIKTSADGQIALDKQNLSETDNDDKDDEYTDLLSEEIDSTLYKKSDDSNLDNEELIKTSELEEFDEDSDDEDYTDLVTEEHLSTADLSETTKTKSDLISTSIIENLEESDDNLAKTKKKDLNLSETKLSPTKRFWEPLVGNPQYGFYNKKSWNWVGYFDRLKKWIPYSDSNQAPQNPTFHNSLITKKSGNFNFWKKLVDNLDYGHRENGNWIWDGVFDQNFNWIPDPTIVKGSNLEKVDLSVDNDLYEKYVGNEYYGYYDDDHKWVWTGKFSTDGTFIPDKIDLVVPKADLTENEPVKTDIKQSVDHEKENQETSEARKERKRLRQERRRLEKLQAKITSEIAEKKTDIETEDGFKKIPGETIEEIRSTPTADLNLVSSEEPALINTKTSKKAEPHFWEAFLGNSAYGHYNSDHQWVWDGYFDDDRNWIADDVAISKKADSDQKLTFTEVEKPAQKVVVVDSSEDLVKKPVKESKVLKPEDSKVEVTLQDTNNLDIVSPIKEQDDSNDLNKINKELLISSPQKTEGVILDQKVEITDSEPLKLKTTDEVTTKEKQKETYLPTVVTEQKPEIVETIKLVSDGNQKVLKILDQTSDASINNAALQSKSKLPPKKFDDQTAIANKQKEDYLPTVVAEQNTEVAETIKLVSDGNQKVLKILDQTSATSINNAALQSESKLPPTPPKVAIQDSEEIILDHYDNESNLDDNLGTTQESEIPKVGLVETAEIPVPSNLVDNSKKTFSDKSSEYKATSVSRQIDNKTQQSLIPEISVQESQELFIEQENLYKEKDDANELSSQKPTDDKSFIKDQSSVLSTPLPPESVSQDDKKSPEIQEEALLEKPVTEFEESTKVNNEIKEEASLSESTELPAEQSSVAALDQVAVEPEKVQEEVKADESVQATTPAVLAEAQPEAEYLEQFVGNKDYGTYDADGNWEWSGYFDDNNNWVSNESVQAASDLEAQNQSFTEAASTPESVIEQQPSQESSQESSIKQPVTEVEELTKADDQVKEEASLPESTEQPVESSSDAALDQTAVEPEKIQEEVKADDQVKEEASLPESTEQPVESSSDVALDQTAVEPEKIQEEVKPDETASQPSVESAPEPNETPVEAQPEAEYWEQFVGNKDYGTYDADGNWEWSGYFDDNNNWVSNESVQAASDLEAQNQSFTEAAPTPESVIEQQPSQESSQESSIKQPVTEVEELTKADDQVKEEASLPESTEQPVESSSDAALDQAAVEPEKVQEEAKPDKTASQPSVESAPEPNETPVEAQPEAEYWEQFVGNKDYGTYDADGNWEWSGYFDDNNNWVSNESVQAASDLEAQNQSFTEAAPTPESVIEQQPSQESSQESSIKQPVTEVEELTKADDQVKEEASLPESTEQPVESSSDAALDQAAVEPEKVQEEAKPDETASQPSVESAPEPNETPVEAQPEAEYWEQFVGNKDYGKYDKDGNWEWSGYFDDENNWIPNDEDDNTEIVEAVEGTNFISADDEGKIDFDKYVGNENFGYYDENNEWEWYEGDFDEDGNWMVYEQGEPDKNFDITEDIPIFKNIDTDSVDADEWLSQFNEEDADTIFGGK